MLETFFKRNLVFFLVFFFSTAAWGEEIHFEAATLEQADFLTNLAMEANSTYHYRNVSERDAKKVFLVEKIHFEKGIVRVMKKGDEIIGFYGLMTAGEGERKINLLTHLFLRADYIGKGYGKALFKEAMRVAEEELYWEALLWESDPHAAWFYKKMGAKKIGENPCPLNLAYRAPVFIYTLGNPS